MAQGMATVNPSLSACPPARGSGTALPGLPQTAGEGKKAGIACRSWLQVMEGQRKKPRKASCTTLTPGKSVQTGQTRGLGDHPIPES